MNFNQSHLIDNLESIFPAEKNLIKKGICKAISLGYANQIFFNKDQGKSFLKMIEALSQPKESGQVQAKSFLANLNQDIENIKESINNPTIDACIRDELNKSLREKYEQLALIENFFLLYSYENFSDPNPNALRLANIAHECYKITGLDKYAYCALLIRSDAQIESFFNPRNVASPFVANGIYELSTHGHSMLVCVNNEGCLKLFDPNQGWLAEEKVKTFFKKNSNPYKFNNTIYFMTVAALGPIETQKDFYHQPIAPVTKNKKNIVSEKIKSVRKAFKARIQSNDVGDINLKGKNDETALLLAVTNCGVEQRNTELVKLLVKAGANVNLKNENGCTPLLRATEHNNLELARLLVESCADVNVENKDGYTPLLYATKHDNVELAKLLVESGADVNVENKDGRKAIHYTLNYRNKTLAAYLHWSASNPKLETIDKSNLLRSSKGSRR